MGDLAMTSINRKSLLTGLCIFLGTSAISCGGGRHPVISVGVSPALSSPPAVVQFGTTAQFHATVTGDPENAGVNWTVTCNASPCGVVSPTFTPGNDTSTTYLAPPSLPRSNLTVTITAASVTESTAQGSSTIIVPSVAVTVTPNPAAVLAGGETQFTATVSGDSTDGGVTWSLVKRECGTPGCYNACRVATNNLCGTVSTTSSPSGDPVTYTAPSRIIGVTLTATSVANPLAVNGASITVSSSSSSGAGDASDPPDSWQAAGMLKSGRLQSLRLLPRSPQTQRDAEPSNKPHYKVIVVGTLGGSFSAAYGGVNDRQWVSGDAFLPGDVTEHGFLWRDGVMTDLGTLGGLNSSVPFPVKNDKGLVTGLAQTSLFDPLGEFWGSSLSCGNGPCQGFQNVEVGFVWKDGKMIQLPTLGGNYGASLGSNNQGQVVGVAETAVQDSHCTPPQVLLFDAVMWGPDLDEIHVLPTLPGDSVAAAVAINDKGDVVGASGVCSFPPFFAFAVHPVLWRHGTVTSLGGLGGTMSNAAFAINNRGQVVGQSNLPGDTFTHAFFWQRGVMTDIGTLPGDANSMATDINNNGQVVGVSCDATFTVCRAFLWEDGVMTDLNTLVSPNSPLFLNYGAGINDRGEISGGAFDRTTGEAPAFLAVPCDEQHAEFEACREHDGENP